MASLSTRFSTSSTGLQVKLFATPLKSIKTNFGPARKVNMDRCSHTSTKIGWARVDIAVLFVKHKFLARFLFDRFSDCLNSFTQSFEDSLDISSLLH